MLRGHAGQRGRHDFIKEHAGCGYGVTGAGAAPFGGRGGQGKHLEEKYCLETRRARTKVLSRNELGQGLERESPPSGHSL